MKSATVILISLGCLAFGLTPGQTKAQDTGTKAPVAHKQVISANPFLLLWEWGNIEYERKVSPKMTVGAAASVLSVDDVNYESLNGLLRYYPQGAAMSGFSFGGRLGVHNGSDDKEEGHTFGFGVDIGYSWLLGADRNFYIGMGFGLTRFFGGDLEEDRVVLPSIRLINVGFAF